MKCEQKPIMNHVCIYNVQAPAPASPYGDLEEVLRRAATKDRTVIMTQINLAWTKPGSLLDLFFESFRLGEGGVSRLLDHLVIVTMDPAAYEGCQAVHRHCYFLRTTGVDYRSEKTFMSKDYLEMMWGRNKFQQTILELGYNFLFTVSTKLFSSFYSSIAIYIYIYSFSCRFRMQYTMCSIEVVVELAGLGDTLAASALLV